MMSICNSEQNIVRNEDLITLREIKSNISKESVLDIALIGTLVAILSIVAVLAGLFVGKSGLGFAIVFSLFGVVFFVGCLQAKFNKLNRRMSQLSEVLEREAILRADKNNSSSAT